MIDDNLALGLMLLGIGFYMVLGMAKRETFLSGTENYAKDFGYIVFILFMLAAAYEMVVINADIASGMAYVLVLVAFVVFLFLASFGILRIILVNIHKRWR